MAKPLYKNYYFPETKMKDIHFNNRNSFYAPYDPYCGPIKFFCWAYPLKYFRTSKNE